MLPPLPQSTQRLGVARLTWLNTLKAWNWNSVFILSPMKKALKRPKSASKYFGPWNWPIPAFPKASRVAVWAQGPAFLPSESNATPLVVWNQYPVAFGSPDRGPSLTLPKTSGRQGPWSMEAEQELSPGVHGS